MALTVTQTDAQKSLSVGNLHGVTGTIDFDSSYATGGESLVATDIGLMQDITYFHASPCKGVIFEYDYSGKKLKAVFPTGGAGTPASALGVPAATAASANAVVPAGGTTVTSSGAQPTLTITQPTITSNPGVGAEVASTQNLSTLTGVRFFALGI